MNTSGASDDAGGLAASFLAWFLGCVAVYAALFATGYLLYARIEIGLFCVAIAILAGWALWRVSVRRALGLLLR